MLIRNVKNTTNPVHDSISVRSPVWLSQDNSMYKLDGFATQKINLLLQHLKIVTCHQY